MKKLIIFFVLFAFVKQSDAQIGYTQISQRYNWLAGIFKALGVPSGDAAAFTTGQAVRAGALYYDSTGADSGLYVYSGLSWQRAGSSLDTTSLSNRIDLRLLISDTSDMLSPYLYNANEGLSVSGKYAQLGGITTSPATLSSNRRIDLNDKILWFTDGPDVPDSSAYVNRYTPFNVLVFHDVTTDEPGYDVLPKAGFTFRRTIRFTSPALRAQNRYGMQSTMRYEASDSAIIRTDGGDYGGNKSELAFGSTPGFTGRTVFRLGHGTGAPERSNEAPYAHIANVMIDDQNPATDNVNMRLRGHTMGYRSYLLMGGTKLDTLDAHIFYGTSSFVHANKHIFKSYVLKPDVWWNQVDSAFLIFDTARAATSGLHTRAFWRAKTKIGGDVGWVSPYQFAVGGSTFIEDSLVHGLRLAVTDTTGVDIMVRDRATGILKYITADDLGVGGGGATPTLQQVFDQEGGGSLLTKNDTILNDYTLNVIGNSSVAFSPLLSVNNSSTTGGGIVARSAGTNSSFYGVNTKTSSGGGSAFVGESQGSNATAVLTRDSSSTNTTVPVLQLIRSTSGSAANDIGASISFGVETTSGVTEEVAGYGVKLSNATSATKETEIDITGKDNSVTETFMNIQKDLVRINNNADTLATLADVRAGGGGGGSTAWGGITGTLADQTDLQTALDAKLAHTTANPAITTTTPSGTGVTPSTMFAIERSDFTGQNINTVQPVFSTGQDVWTLQGSTTYEIEGLYYFNHGATSHSVGLSFELGGGASLTSISYFAVAQVIAVGIISSAQTSILVQTETNAPVTNAGAVPNEIISFKGYITMNAGGTVTPSYTFSAAPGGTVLTKAGSYIKFTPVGTNVISKVGNVN